MRHFFFVFLFIFVVFFSAAPADCQSIIFEENFDDGNANGFFPDCNLWIINDAGHYEIENWGFEIISQSYFGEYSWTDFILSLDMLTSGSVQNSVGFRVQENGNMYVATMRGEPYKDVFLFKIINGHQYQLFTQNFSNTLTEWHHLEVVATGNNFLFLVNGELAFDYTDNNAPFLSGRQSLYSYTGGVVQHQVLKVDNVVVYNPTVSSECTSLDGLKALFR